MNIRNEPLIQKLLSLELPSEDYAIFGSTPMTAHGIKNMGHDLDVIARGKAWEKAKKFGTPQTPHSGIGQVVLLFENQIEIFNTWSPGKWDTEQLIKTAEVIEGIRFVKLEHLIKWKKNRGNPKDLKHIQMIEEISNFTKGVI